LSFRIVYEVIKDAVEFKKRERWNSVSGRVSKVAGTNREPIKPIVNIDYIIKIRDMLWDRPRDLLLFDFCIRTGLTLKNILRLKVADLHNVQVGQSVRAFKEFGKSNNNSVIMSEALYQSFQRYVEVLRPEPEAYLFKSRKGLKPLNVSSASNMINRWFEAIGLTGLSGVSSLKKTWQLHFAGPAPTEDERVSPPNTFEQLRPIQAGTRTLWERIYRELLSAIIAGRIRPGDKLNMEIIAGQMEVSLMPVRQAIQRLESIGFVRTQKKKGTVVNKLSLDNFSEIFEVRLSLESFATHKACQNISQQNLDEMERLHELYAGARQNSDVEEFIKLNRAFHFSLYSYSHNPTLLKMINELWDKVSPYLHLLLRDVKGYRRDMSFSCHQEILDGLRRRDPDKVVKWVRADLTQGAEKLVKAWQHKNTSRYLK